MEPKEYIESGILESFVLGELSEKESEKVMEMAGKYPEVREAIEAIELALEKSGFENAVEVPPALEQQIKSRLFADHVSNHSKTEYQKVNKNNFSFWKAAAIILIAISSGFNIWLYKKWRESQQEIASLGEERKFLVKNNIETTVALESSEEKSRLLLNRNIKAIPLHGTEIYKGFEGTVFFNENSGDTYVELPANDNDVELNSDFQLWAIIDGKPVDAGVVKKRNGHFQFQSKLSIGKKPSAFAVTREAKGGSPTPTLDKMILIGNAG